MTPHSKHHLNLAFILFYLFFAADVFSTNINAVNKLDGLWGVEKFFGLTTSIRVTINIDDNKMLAYAFDETVAVNQKGKAIEFTFSGKLGSFRGTYNEKKEVIVGHWITEPSSVIYSRYATPLRMNKTPSGSWLGEVKPIESHSSMYLSIQSNTEGKMQVFLRNPEQNQGVFTRLSTVEKYGDKVLFLNKKGEKLLTGVFHGDTLSIFFPEVGTYDFTRRERSNAPGFFPRNNTEAYEYRRPVDLGDGWTTASPKDVGMSQEHLEALVQSILDTPTDALWRPYLQSLVIARRGKLILEEYFYGYHSDKPHDLRSASKSVTGLMVGLAIDEVKGLTLDSPVYPIFSELVKTNDPNKKALKLKHLISMSSGFACDENDDESPGGEGRMQEEQDWWKYTLDLPMSHKPGTKSAYCSAGMNLAAGIVSLKTDVWLPEFFRSRLAEPLQIEHYHMNLDALGHGYGGGGIHMRPRDFLKLAQTMLDKGKWNGRQIVSAPWVKKLQTPQAGINQANDYGYSWWVGEFTYLDGKVKRFSAEGNGGQFLIVVPELELVVAINGGNYGNYRTWVNWRNKLVPEKVFKAILD